MIKSSFFSQEAAHSCLLKVPPTKSPLKNGQSFDLRGRENMWNLYQGRRIILQHQV